MSTEFVLDWTDMGEPWRQHDRRNEEISLYLELMRRRDLLRWGMVAGVGWVSGGVSEGLHWTEREHDRSRISECRPVPEAPQSPKALISYVDPLPLPPAIRPAPGETLPIPMTPGIHKAHRDLPETAIWGYRGVWPGPTIRVHKEQPLLVRWDNQLPAKHMFPVDNVIHGCGKRVPEVRTAVHVHGARVLPDSDGYPEAWSSSDGKLGPSPAASPARYPNRQQSATLWYHDHALGITRLNIYAGLAGFFLVEDDRDTSLSLPRGEFDIPLMLQDRTFNKDGSLFYPVALNGARPVWVQEFFGDYICVNGKVAPFLEVEPRRYRFRFLNASNSRSYRLRLTSASGPGGKQPDTAALPIVQIGSDAGLLPKPVELQSLFLAPGERCEMVIDFTSHKKAQLQFVNDAPAPFPCGGAVVPSDVLLFKVTKPLSTPDVSSIPTALAEIQPLDSRSAVRERVLGIRELEREPEGDTIVGLLDMKHWYDPISERPKAGTTEIWTFVNVTTDMHPIHLHQVHFQVLNRQRFDADIYLRTGRLVPQGPVVPPEPEEQLAWKDTVRTWPGYVTRIIQSFELPAGTPTTPGQEFRYVWHCHILEHEDNEMMRPYCIVA